MGIASRIAQRDPVFGRISRAVPRSIEPALRDDIISDVYLEIREGKLHPRDIAAEARRFITAGYAAWANAWGALSLNALQDNDDGPSFLESIVDESSIAAFDLVGFRWEELHLPD